MKTKKAVEIASRIYGLYLLIQIPIALTGLLTVFAIKQDEFLKNPMLYKVWACFHPLIFIIIGIFLILKAEAIANLVVGLIEKEDSNEELKEGSHTHLSFWIILLGIYFFVNSCSQIIGDLIRHPLHWNDSYSWGVFLQHSFMIVASIVLIVKSEWLESTITNRIKR